MEAYSLRAKSELAHLIEKEACCLLAELSALIRVTGSIHLAENHRLFLVFTTENAAVARKIVWLLKRIFQIHVEIVALRQVLRRSQKYEITVSGTQEVQILLERLHLKGDEGITFHNLPSSFLGKKCCQRSFLRGCFLGGGSITDPDKKSYHLEILPGSQELSENILYLMNLCGIKAKLGLRKEYPLVYIKGSEVMIKFLSLIGAHTALLKMEVVRAKREMRGSINRIVNCETANLEKTVQASLQQRDKIKFLEGKSTFRLLSPKLKELAILRLENPEANLIELGEMTRPRCSKSAVNHRMRRLMKIAEELETKGKKT